MISKESLLIYDAKKLKYYRIVITNDAKDLEQLLATLVEKESILYNRKIFRGWSRQHKFYTYYIEDQPPRF